LSDRSFLAVVGVIGLALQITYLYFASPTPVSDFRGMWTLADDIASNGLDEILQMQDPLTQIHLARILPFLLPERLLFGASRWAYSLPNALLNLTMALLVFFLTRSLFNRAAARAAFVFSLAAIEPLLAAAIPTHDIPGTFFTVLCLLVLLGAFRVMARGAMRNAALLSFLVGILLVLIDLQRSTQPFMYGVMLLLLVLWGTVVERDAAVGAASWRKAAFGVVVLLLIPVMTASFIVRAIDASGVTVAEEALRLWRNRAIAGHTDSWGEGTYRYANHNYTSRYDLSAGEWGELAWRKLLTDTYYNPLERVKSYLRKSSRLFSLGTQIAFYLPRDENTRLRPLSPRLVEFLSAANRAYVCVFLLLMLFGVATAVDDLTTRIEASIPAAYLALSAAGMILLFQAQPRYMFPIWFLGAIYAGEAARRLDVAFFGASHE
jgi:4-amino-4-deoxy-L-arabinose transferase-like glycosyltransferase